MMGVFSKLERHPPATKTDFVEDSSEKPTPADVEKVGEAGLVEDSARPSHHVHPEAERAVVRKLDWRVPPLVAALCMNKKYYIYQNIS